MPHRVRNIRLDVSANALFIVEADPMQRHEYRHRAKCHASSASAWGVSCGPAVAAKRYLTVILLVVEGLHELQPERHTGQVTFAPGYQILGSQTTV